MSKRGTWHTRARTVRRRLLWWWWGLTILVSLVLGWALIDASRHRTDAQERIPRIELMAALAIVALMVPVLWGLVRQSRGRYRAEHRLRAIVHSLPGTVYVLRRTPAGVTTFDFLSVNTVELLGIARDDVLRDAGATRQVVIDEDFPSLEAAFARSAADLSLLEVDFRIRKPDGTIRWVRSAGTPVRRANGDVVWNGYCSDITPIKQTKQALRDALQRLDDAHTVAGLGD